MAVLEQLKSLSDERFLTIYEALSERGFGPLDSQVAEVLKFRPQAIRKLPMEKRAKRARKIVEADADPGVCYELFGTYLTKARKELVTDFLDATGVEHEEGMIEDVDETQPDPERIAATVKELDGKFDPEDVTLYLALAVENWPESKALEAAWRERG